MPKRLLKVTNFNKGISLNASQRDPQEGFYPFAENADSGMRGAVRGLKQATQVNNNTFAAVKMAPYVTSGQQVLIGVDASRNVKTCTTAGATNSIGSVPHDVTQMIPNGTILIAACGANPAQHISFADRQRFGTALNGFQINENAPKGLMNEEGHAWHTNTTNTYNDESEASISRPLVSLLSAQASYVEREANGTLLGQFQLITGAKQVGKTYEYVEETDETTPVVLEKGKIYAYAVSAIYDGYQESPLTKSYTQVGGGGRSSGTVRTRYFTTKRLIRNCLGIEVELSVRINNLNTRVTGFNVYRAEVSNEDGEPVEDFRFVRSIPVDDSSSSEKWTSGTFNNGFYGTDSLANVYTFSFYDDGFAGASYEDNSGLPQTLELAHLDFELGAVVNEYMFVSGVAPNKFFDATEGLIFRSVAGSPSVFNVIKDFIQLPEPITAIAEHESRVYAFSKTKTYRINPTGLYVEAVNEGYGALSQDHVCSTPYGIVQADNSGIYINTGSRINSIGSRVSSGGYSANVGYKDITQVRRDALKLAYDPEGGRLGLFGQYNSTQVKAWLYDFDEDRWDFYVPSNMAVTAVEALAVIEGGLYLSDGSDLFTLFSAATRERIVLVTYDYTLNSDTGEFWLYKVIIRGELHADGEFIQYRVDQGNWVSIPTGSVAFSSSLDGKTHTLRFSSNPKIESIQLLLGYFAEIDTITFQFRLPVVDE